MFVFPDVPWTLLDFRANAVNVDYFQLEGDLLHPYYITQGRRKAVRDRLALQGGTGEKRLIILLFQSAIKHPSLPRASGPLHMTIKH